MDTTPNKKNTKGMHTN